jgi:two-component system NtrC family sensor kinase
MADTRIMIVEDEIVVARHIESGLRGLGYAVCARVSSGEEAISQAVETGPDLVLMDIKLQGALDGVEAAEEIHSRLGIPVVYLTAYADEETLARAKITEPFGYIVKPFEIRELHTTIQMALHKHGLERQLAKSEARYRTVSELTSDFAYAIRVEPDGALVLEWATETLTRITGMPLDQLTSDQDWMDLIYSEDMPVFLENVERSLSGHPIEKELRIVDAGGEVHWLRVHGRPGWDEPQGRVVSIVGAVRDITAHRQAEGQLRKLSRAVEASPNIVVITDVQGNIEYVNRGFTQITGYTAQEAVSETPRLLKSDRHTAAFYAELWDTILSGKEWHGEFANKNKNGEIYWEFASIAPVKDAYGEITHFVKVAQDITQRVCAEGELQRHRDQLEQLVERRTAELEAINEQLKQEVTERKRVEDVLRTERDFAESLIEMAQAIILVLDPEGRIVRFNPYLEELSGYRLEEVQGQDWFATFLPESDRESMRTLFLEAVDNTPTRGKVNPIVTKDGGKREIEWYDKTLKDDDGNVVGLLAIGQDVTRRKWAEQALVDSEKRYRSLFDGVPVGLYRSTPDGHILDANLAMVKMLGYPDRETLLKADAADLYADPRQREQWQGLLENQNVLLGMEWLLRRHDGTTVWVEENVQAVRDDEGRVWYYEGSLEDITDRKRMQAEIKRRNEGLDTLNKVSAAAISSLELDAVLRQILERTCGALDAIEGSILLRDLATDELFFAVSLTDDPVGLRDQRLAPGQGIAGWVVQHGQPVRVNDVRNDPRWHPEVDVATGLETRSLLCAPLMHHEQVGGVIEVINRREGDFDAEDLDLLVSVASVTATALENARLFTATKVRVEELTLLNEIALSLTATLDYSAVVRVALFQTQRLFRADGVSLLQPDPQTGELCFVQALERQEQIDIPVRLAPGEGIAGWALTQDRAVVTADAQQDPRFSHRVDDYLGMRTRALMSTPLRTPERSIGVLEVISQEVAIYNRDDLRVLQAISSTLAVALQNAHLYAEQKQLVREREEAQARLVQSEKMSALGRLAASIAHEINNPLQAIQGCLTLVGEEMAAQQRRDKLARYLGIVDSEIERIAAIVRRMRDFYRPARKALEPTDLHGVLADVLELSSKQLQHGDVAVERDWAADLPRVQANSDHLRQVFLNLLLNALDAMPEGGRLRIATSLDEIQGEGNQLRQAVQVVFSDTGAGMSQEAQAQLFEPFFTTKPDGTGLGLSIIYQIIQAHSGQIEVESQKGEGTTFTILLPVAQG